MKSYIYDFLDSKTLKKKLNPVILEFYDIFCEHRCCM